MYGPRATTDRATWAGICDIRLGGSGFNEHDRRAVNRIAAAFPHEMRDLPDRAARISRQFQVRSIHHAVGNGINQFIDIGCGRPSVWGNPHENVPSGARVVLVDIEKRPVDEYKKLLAHNDNALVIHADMREPDTILEHPELHRYIDFPQPVWLGMLKVLSFVHLRPGDSLYDLVRQYTDVLAPRSHFALSVTCFEDVPQDVVSALNTLDDVYYEEVGQRMTLFTVPHIERLLDDTEKLTAISYVSDCLLGPDDEYVVHEDPAKRVMRAAVGRIPA
jgi:hypothetical protein